MCGEMKTENSNQKQCIKMVGNIGILYEDPYILVCRKPAGVPVQSANARVKDMVSILKLYLLEESGAEAAEAAETEAKSLKAKYEDSLKNAHDESISILNKAKINARAEYDRIVLVVNIYQAVQRQQHFGLIENAFIRIVDAKTNQEMCKYNLTEDYSGMTAMIFGEIYRHNGEWKFNAIGQGTNDPGLGELVNRYV